MTPTELAARPKSGKGSRTTTIEDPSIVGQSFYTYVEERNEERRMQRPLDTEVNTRPLSWGKIAEKKGFQNLTTEYQLTSDVTIVHPDFDCYAGSPDAFKYDEGKTVGELKSPMTLTSFSTLVKPIYKLGLTGIMAMEWLRQNHPDGEKYFWQIVSNAILSDSEHGELIIFVPYKSELQDIKDMASPSMLSMEEMKHYYWIYSANDDELPWLPDGGYYRNINTIRFRVSESDKKFLLERVKMGQKLLIPRAA